MNCSAPCGTAIMGTPARSPSLQPPMPAWVTKASALFQDRPLRDPGVHLDVGREGAEFFGDGVLADLECDVPAGQVAEGRDALAVERGLACVRGAERDQQHVVRGRRAGPAVRVRSGVEAGADEGHRVGVDSIGGRLHRSRDQGEGPGGRTGERVHVRGGRIAVGEPPCEPVPVRVGAGQFPQMRRDFLLVAVPADERRGQLHQRTALGFAEGARGIGADVVEVQIGRIMIVGGAQLRERLDGVVEEEACRGDGIGRPVVVRDGQRGGAGHQLRVGGLDLVRHERVVGVGDPVPAGHQLTDESEAGQDVADDGDAAHRDMGTATGHGRSLVSGAGRVAGGVARTRCQGWSICAAASSRSATVPDMIVRTCLVMDCTGQSHHATARSRAMSAAS